VTQAQQHALPSPVRSEDDRAWSAVEREVDRIHESLATGVIADAVET
jgi:hypothetical protein